MNKIYIGVGLVFGSILGWFIGDKIFGTEKTDDQIINESLETLDLVPKVTAEDMLKSIHNEDLET